VNGPVFDPAMARLRTAMGGAGSPGAARLAAGEIPSRGHYAITFRPVRREGPAARLVFSAPAAQPGVRRINGIAAWSFGEEQIVKPATPARAPLRAPKIPMIEADNLLAGKTEITYAQWKRVFSWAEVHGYRFDHDGDIGSVKWDATPAAHRQDEPVTSVSALDAMVWCNALSELHGLKPCYYDDPALTKPMRVVHPARVIALPNRTTIYYAKPRLDGLIEKLVYVDTNAHGYRLPTNAEWTRLAGGTPSGSGHARDVAAAGYPSGPTLDPATAWFRDNSGERTHPCGATTPTGAGFHDLAGNVFEWVLEPQKQGGWQAECRGGSHRSENRSDTTPALNNKFVTRYSVGGGLAIGLANDEIGFRIVRSKQ